MRLSPRSSAEKRKNHKNPKDATLDGQQGRSRLAATVAAVDLHTFSRILEYHDSELMKKHEKHARINEFICPCTNVSFEPCVGSMRRIFVAR
jgi:hypothetical protein